MTIFGTLWPKQNHPVIRLRHNGGNKHLATVLSMYFLDMLIMDLFPIYFTQNRYFCFYFLTLAFYFVPSLGKFELGSSTPQPIPSCCPCCKFPAFPTLRLQSRQLLRTARSRTVTAALLGPACQFLTSLTVLISL